MTLKKIVIKFEHIIFVIGLYCHVKKQPRTSFCPLGINGVDGDWFHFDRNSACKISGPYLVIKQKDKKLCR